MEPITLIRGAVTVLDRADVDTDQIIPAQYLKRIERTGFGPFLFDEWRKDPGFVLNDPRFQGASILITGSNFGSGSSREHAPWALEDYGFRAIIAPSFADIFRNNCSKIGLLLVQLRPDEVEILMHEAEHNPGTQITVDLESQTVGVVGQEWTMHFDIDPFLKFCLTNGLDDIGLTMQHADSISNFEKSRPGFYPH